MNLTLLPAIVNSCGPSTLNLDIGTNHLVKHNGRKCLQKKTLDIFYKSDFRMHKRYLLIGGISF